MTVRFAIVTSFIVITSAVIGGGVLRAQKRQNGFAAYLRQLPAPAEYSSDQTLKEANESTLDVSADIDAVEERMRSYLRALQGKNIDHSPIETNAGLSRSALVNRPSNDASSAPNNSVSHIPHIINKPQAVPTDAVVNLDSLIRIAKAIQAVEVEFKNYFDAVENTYEYRVNVVNELARKEQMKEPCDGNTDCFLRHRRNRNLGLLFAEKLRIDIYAELLRHEISRLGPILTQLDEALPSALAASDGLTTRSTLTDIASEAVNALLSVSEHLKLNRYHLWYCAHLLHESDG